ncbi:unnamed protein product [Symbiodinium pilosum]|uniref:Uncharacterized protein n=1 Tax=Symbiodinium pilosum TaxID=2952 RepID=A0A812LLW8_SYMPI|nr:unnamed protein product [Symbiodinium pilosum]
MIRLATVTALTCQVILEVSSYKVAMEPHELCYDQSPDCEKLKALWGCAGTWREKCPGMKPPEGEAAEDSLDVTVATICPVDCPDGSGEAAVDLAVQEEMAKANGTKQIDEGEVAKVNKTLQCLGERMKAALDMKDLREARELLAVIQGETAEKIRPIKDNQTATAVDMKARDAAEDLVQQEFANDAKALQKIKLTPQAVENFAKEVEALATMCNDAAEASAIGKMEEAALMRISEHGKPKSVEAAATAEGIAESVREKCHARTLNLDFFVEHSSMMAGAHCGSVFLQEHHMKQAAVHLKELNFRAKAAMALHDDSNRLGHHMVRHLQRHTEHSGEDEHRPSMFLNETLLRLVHEAAKAPLTDHQLERLHHLDSLHFAELHQDRDRDEHCMEREDMAKHQPDHWSLHHKDINAYMDRLCVQKRPSLVCEAIHYENMTEVAEWAVQMMQEPFDELNAEGPEEPPIQWHSGMSQMTSQLQTYANSSQELGFIPIGPCDEPLSCNICTKGICLSVPFPKVLDDADAPFTPGDQGKNVLGALRQGLDSPAQPCFSVDCTACIGLKPSDPLKFNMNVAVSGACNGKYAFFSSFVISIGLEICISGGPLERVLKFLRRDSVCIAFPSLEYYPFVGKMGVTWSWHPIWLFKAVKFSLSAYWPVHGLAPAVKHHCWWNPVKQWTWAEISWSQQTFFNNAVWMWNQMHGRGGHEYACVEFKYMYPACPWDINKARMACRATFLEGRRSVVASVSTRARDLSMVERWKKEWR